MALRYNRFRDRLPRKQRAVMPVTVFETIKDGATIFAAARGTILSVVPDIDIHPELRSAARFVPRKLIYPSALPVLRRLTA